MLENHQQYLSRAPYGLASVDKRNFLTECLNELTRHHYRQSKEYEAIASRLGYEPAVERAIEDLPFIPVQLFKEYELSSVPRDKVVKVIKSSGTSGQQPSKIYLDSPTARSQSKCLYNIISSFIGTKRLPMLILDTELVKKDRSMFSARGAGIIGFSMFGRDVCYAMDDNMQLRLDALEEFVEKHRAEPIVLFGYTYMIWQFFYKVLKERGLKLDIADGFLFHIGGWKKLQAEQVDSLEYNRLLRSVCGDIKIYNYYGMTEQLGSVFVECEHGHKHCSIFSDVIIRSHEDFHVCSTGESGLMELVSILPSSYPGHILLTEDEGRILGEDDCPCGRKGKYFEILGRIKNAEVRGCSDTYGR